MARFSLERAKVLHRKIASTLKTRRIVWIVGLWILLAILGLALLIFLVVTKRIRNLRLHHVGIAVCFIAVFVLLWYYKDITVYTLILLFISTIILFSIDFYMGMLVVSYVLVLVGA